MRSEHQSSRRTATHDVPAARLLRRGGAAPVDREALRRALHDVIEGEVLFDDGTRGLYAQDASNYFEVPVGVVLPRSAADVARGVAACRAFGAPILCRTGGTALAGQTCNHAVVFDFSRYMNRILALEPGARRARVEPGVICDQLVDAAAPSGLTWGPKPATHTHCCFGGMLANNCGGMEAQRSGVAVHNVEAMEVLLHDGTTLQLGWTDEAALSAACEQRGRAGAVHRALRAFRERYAPLIRERFPRIPRRVSGYNLDQLLPDADGRFNLARALVGSEGTCAIMLEATVQLVPLHAHQVVLAAGFADVFRAADAVPAVLRFDPSICEGMDDRLADNISDKDIPERRHLHLLPRGGGWLLIELQGDDPAEVCERARALAAELRDAHGALDTRTVVAPEERAGLWKVREAGLGSTAFVPRRRDTWPGWEDSAVAPERFGAYLRDLNQLFQRYGYAPALYGHFGQGLLHCRVPFDLITATGLDRYRAFVTEAADLCAGKYGGSLSGEHGDGQARGWLLERMFGAELMGAMREFKAIWDPDGKLNPGKIVDAKPMLAELRLGPSYDPAQPETHFRFPQDEGSFARATLRCVGVGKCRREHARDQAPDDVMCPSYMVTRDEKHSTRGRAHLLWEMMRGGDSPIRGGFRDPHVKEALDLCLACKGCKGDCPVNVDVATYKAEFFAHYWRGRLRPRHAYAFGWIDKWSRLAALAPGLVNALTHAKATAWFAKWCAGMAAGRDVPRFAPETFVAWARRRTPRPSSRRAVLWPDTFNNHFHPETARAALQVLEAAGYEVIVPQQSACCGRPLYDYGFLNMARRYLERVLAILHPWLEQGLPIVVLEPSCASVFRDELLNLMPSRVEAQRLARQTHLLSELLADDPALERWKLEGRAIAQGHCHHKAVLGYDAERRLFERLGLETELLSSGCCGMAGSFGFEREASKQAVAAACGERALLPAVRAADPDTLLIADGFSCRTQIAQGSGREALHVAQVLERALDRPAREVPAPAQLPRARAGAAFGAILLLSLVFGLASWWLR